MLKRKMLLFTAVFLMTFAVLPLAAGHFSVFGQARAATYSITPKSKPCIKKYAKKNRYLNKNTINYFTLRSYMEKLEKKGGGTLVLKKGTYYVTNPVFVPSNTTIKLKKGAVIKKKLKTGVKGFKAAQGVFYLCRPSKSAKKNVVKGYSGVKKVVIQGESGSAISLSKTASNAVVLGHCNNVKISGIAFKNLKGGNGIRIVGSSNVTVTGCGFSGVKAADKAGVQITNPDPIMDKSAYKWMKKDKTPCKNIIIEKCRFKTIGKGVATSQFTKGKFHTGVKIRNNTFTDIKTEAVRVINWKEPVIENNTFDGIGLGSKISAKNLGRGVFLLGVKNPVIRNNSFSRLARIVQMTKFKNDNKTAKKKYGVTVNELTKDNLSDILKENTVKGSVVEGFVRNNKTYGSTDSKKYYIHYPDYSDESYTITPATTPYHHEYMTSPKYSKSTLNFFTMQSYMDHFERKGGGILYLSKGTYNITQMVCIPSNVKLVLKDGAVINDASKTARTYVLGFATPSTADQRLAKGYDGVKNSEITAESRGGGTINMKGIEGNAVAFAHNSSCSVSNIHFTGKNKGHYLEVDATKDCYAADCDFDTGKSASQEAINLDTPDRITEGFTGKWSSLDCTPNDSFTVTGCTFKNMNVAIGTHSYSYGKPHVNTVIRDNTFVNVNEKVIQPMNWKDSLIENNTFTCTPEAGKAVIMVRGSSNLTLRNNTFNIGETVTGSDGSVVSSHTVNNIYAIYVSSAYHASAPVGSEKYNVKAVDSDITEENRNSILEENVYNGVFDRRLKIFRHAAKTSSGWQNTDQESPVLMLP